MAVLNATGRAASFVPVSASQARARWPGEIRSSQSVGFVNLQLLGDGDVFCVAGWDIGC